MLTHLNVKNFAIVKYLDIDFPGGMTCITGETGAGKSIAIDALNLCLGERADAGSVRTGETKAEITACFDITDSIPVHDFLRDNDFEAEEDEIIIRRTISSDGKSKAYINGTSVTLSQMRALGELLVIIHGQHAHQLLFKQDYQTAILDKYADLLKERQNLGKTASEIRNIEDQISKIEANREQYNSRRDLLQFQLDELSRAEPKENEYQELDQEYSRLANADEIISSCEQCMQHLEDNERSSALSAVQNALKSIERLQEIDAGRLDNVVTMLSEAEISIQESYDEIKEYGNSIEYDPQRMSFLEQRISLYDSLAQKYHVTPEKLYAFAEDLKKEYESMTSLSDSEDELKRQMQEKREEYQTKAKKLSEKRKEAAQELSRRISSHMHDLAMPHGQFTIGVNYNSEAAPSSKGNDEVSFLVSVNPGQEPGPLNAVVSGGELSRISLAIQEIHAEKVQTPTLIFDEVDTGISGQTANVVGRLLSSLGASAQVICVTHLPQVASKAHHQMFVEKKVENGTTTTGMKELDDEGRIREIARLLSGDAITENALASARDLLASVQK